MLRQDAGGRTVGHVDITALAVIMSLFVGANWLVASEPPATGDPSSVPVYAASPIANQLFTAASADFNQRRFDRAATKFQLFVDRYPDDPLVGYANHYIGVSSQEQGELKDAVTMFAKVVRSNVADAIKQESLLQFGWCLFKLGDADQPESWHQAETVFRIYREQYPESARLDEAFFLHGETLYKQEKYDEAQPMYRAVVDRFPQSDRRPDALFTLALVERELGNTEISDRYFQELITVYPNDPRTGSVHFEVAERAFQAGDYDRADKLYRKVTPDHPQADLAMIRRAVGLSKKGDHAAAALLYQQLPGKYPESKFANDAWLAAGHHFVGSRDYTNAKRCLQQVAGSSSTQGDKAHHWLVRCYLETGKPAQALATAEAGLKRKPLGAIKHNLLLDRADALAALKDRTDEAFVAYAETLAEAQLPVLVVRSLQGLIDSSRTQKQYEYIVKVASHAAARETEMDAIVSAKVALATAHMNLGDSAATSRVYRELLEDYENHPSAPEWVTNAAWSLVLTEEYNAALSTLADYQNVLKAQAIDGEVDLIRGFSLAKLEQFEPAVEHLTRVVELAPGTPNAADALEALVRCYRRLEQWDEAEQAVHQLVRLDASRRESPAMQLDLAEIAYFRGDSSTAEDHYQRVVSGDSDPTAKASGLHRLAWINIRNGNTEQAIGLLNQLMAEHAGHELGRKARLDRARCYQLLDKHSAAIKDLWTFLENTTESDKLEATAVFALGISFVHENRTGDALTAFANVRDNYPTFSRIDEALYQLGALYYKLDKSHESIAAFEQLLRDHPDSELAASAEFHLGQLRSAKSDHQAAIQHLKRAVADGANAAFMDEAYYRLGWAYYRNADFGLAAESFANQLAKDERGPLTHESRFMLAESLFGKRDWSKAMVQYDRLLDAAESNSEMQVDTLLHGGLSAIELRDFEKGAEWLRRVVRDHADAPQRVQAELGLGRCCARQERFVSAEHHFETAISRGTSEESARARYELAQLYVRQELHREAIRELERLIQANYGDSATPGIRQLQSLAGRAAAECATVIAANAEYAEDRAVQLARAADFWRYIIESHPNSHEADEARQRIDEIVTLGTTAAAAN